MEEMENILECSSCRHIYESMSKEERRRGVGMRKTHILTTAKGDCPNAWTTTEPKGND